MKKPLLSLFFLLLFHFSFAQSVKREVRAIWLTTHLGLDWPTMTDPVATKKAKLITMLDSHKALGINTIYFQVRGVADAFYPSTIVPWTNRLTGSTSYGVDPGWDPLQFAIEECHKRGMEIHAWLNPFRAATDVALIPSYSATHKAVTNPEWLLASGVIRYFNPGLEAVRTHVTDVVKEIVNNYDVDGIHFDDYFYQSTSPGDSQTFADFPRGFTDISNWRRDNINLVISGVNSAIKAIKPWVKFGASPSGIYRSKSVTYPEGSETGTGTTQHYAAHFADSKYWLDQGYVDYLVPQVYWYIGQTNSDFAKLIPWWNSVATNRHVYIGVAAYKVNDAAQGAFKTNANEISDQFNLIRANLNLTGAAFFRSAFVISNPLNFRTNLLANHYAKPALVPTMSWLDNTGPEAATNLTSTLNGSNKTVLTWTAPTATAIELDKVSKYAIYRSTNQTIDFDDINNLVGVTNTSTDLTYTDISVTPGTGTVYYYAVKALDRLSNESISSNVVKDGYVTLPVSLLSFEAKKNGQKAELSWSTATESNNDRFVIERSANGTDFTVFTTVSVTDANSSTIKNYNTIDLNPLGGTNYYRLVQFDKDGTRKELGIKSVQFDQLSVFKVTAYPNPTTEQINFAVENYTNGKIKAKLVNAYGRVLHRENFENNGNSTFTLSLKQKLAPGYYVLNVEHGKSVQSLKVIVL